MNKKIWSCFLLIVSVGLFFTCSPEVYAKKKKEGTSQAVKVLSNDGEEVIYGSVLNPNDDEVNILLSKQLLSKIRKAGLGKLTVHLTSSLDSTKTYTVPSDSISIQRKVLSKKGGRFLVISLFNLSTQSGITVSPSSLPTDDYRLRIAGSGLSVVTDDFNYQTPVLIVGNVDSQSGLVSVEDLGGGKISERTVAINPNGSFFTEVRAKNINSETKVRRYIRKQTVDGDTTGTSGEVTEEIIGEEEIDTGVVHCVTDTDLYAITPLENDPDSNTARANKPLLVDESTTLTANLAKENEELAAEIAKNELEDLINEDIDESEFAEEEEFDESEFEREGCNIGQFASRCNTDSEDALALIGKDFRNFLQVADCRFPEFGLIKKIILAAPDDINAIIGKGYCEHVGREVDEDKPCQIYAQVLRDFKEGRMPELICPPPFCNEFKSIRPPRCFEPGGFCEGPVPGPEPFGGPRFAVGVPRPPVVCVKAPCPGPMPPDRCIHKPMKDLFCSRIGSDIKAEECRNDEFDRGPFSPNWKIVKNSKGNEYCVPSNIPQPPPPPPGIVDWMPPPSTPDQIAEECEVNACHRKCEEKFGMKPGPFPPGPPPPITFAGSSEGVRGGVRGQVFGGFPEPMPPAKCEVCDCHFACDADAGRVVDCGNTDSKYFSIKCCEQGSGGPPVLYTNPALPVVAFQKFGGPSFGPPPSGGFGGGYQPPPPSGMRPIFYDKRACLCEDKNNFDEKGFVKSEAGNLCKDKCPAGFERIPGNPDCFPICAEGLLRDPGGICRKKCQGVFIDDGYGGCRCPEGYVFNKGRCEPPQPCPEYCKNMPVFRKLLESHIATTGPGYIPPGTFSGPSSTSLPPECQKCFGGGGPANCPWGQKWDPATYTCIGATCDAEQYLDPTGNCRCKNDGTIPRGPGPEGCRPMPPATCPGNMIPNPQKTFDTTGAQCICPSGLPYWDGQAQQCAAVCPGGNPSPSASVNMPPGSPIPCTGGGTQRYCGYIDVPARDNCVCAPGGTPMGPNGECRCPMGQPYSTGGCGPSTGGNYCPAEIPPSSTNPCTCSPPATPSGPNGVCRCPGGEPYTPTGCVGGTQRYCQAGEMPSPSNPCICASPAYNNGPNTPCQCPPGSSIAYSAQGCGGQVRNCNSGEAQAPLVCQCATPATPDPGNICRCPDGGQYSQSGCTGGGLNYCSPGILVGTSGCTCNPTGGAYSLNGYCTCPANSGSYTKETGCPSTTSRTCNPGEVLTANVICTCPSGAHVGSANTCVCNDGTQAPAAGCSATVSHTCIAGEISTTANPCTCASPGYTSGANTACVCPSGYSIAYSAQGCGSQLRNCAPGEAQTPFVCQCASPATSTGTSGTCQCPSGQTYSATGCGSSTVTCTAPKVVDSTGLTCVCPTGQVQDPNNAANCIVQVTCTAPKVLNSTTNTCQCPTGQVQDPNNAANCVNQVSCTYPKVHDTPTNTCVCPTGRSSDSVVTCTCPSGQVDDGTACVAGQFTLSTADKSGSNITFTFTKNFSQGCFSVKDSAGAQLSSFCQASGAPISSTVVGSATSVKLCSTNWQDVCSNLVTVTGQ